MVNSLTDGLSLPDQFATAGIDAAEISGGAVTAAELGTDAVTTAKISGLAVTAAKIGAEAVTIPKHQIVATGSPTAYGNGVQFGTGTLTAGSNLVVVFGTAFKATPNVVAMHTDGATVEIWAGSNTANVGSVTFEGITASRAFSWIACGSM